MSNSPCSTCAFGQSGGAADEANNRLKGIICALAGIPFHCHHARLPDGSAGQEYNWRRGALGPFELPPSERRLCKGWKRTVGRLAAREHYRFTEVAEDQFLLRRYQKGLGSAACRALDDFLATQEPEAKAKARRDLRTNLEALRAKDGL